MRFSPKRVSGLAFSGGVLALLLAGCGEKPQMNPGMPQVSVITVQPQRTPIISELPGRVDAVRDAQIRSRVTGIVQKIAFEQGGDVKENQLLFKIDPAPYKAAYDQATAQLKQAQANLFSAKLLADRYGPLVKANAVSKQEYDNAVAAYRQADATVAAAKAAQDNASINLGYTDVTSPITGRIGKPLVTEGALVEATSATQMATVQQLDPIYVDFTQSTADLAALRRAFASGKLQQVGKDAARATVRVVKQPGKGAKPITTRYRVLKPLGKGRSLIELEPVTGRTHQLRAHMAFYGHPLLGDDKYGDRADRAARQLAQTYNTSEIEQHQIFLLLLRARQITMDR